MIWLVLLAMLLAALAVALAPLLRRSDSEASAIEADRAVYRDQLAELDREQAAGHINAEEAAEARLEVQRRLLRTQQEESATRPLSVQARIRLGGLILLGLIACSAGSYWYLGNPQLPGAPLAQRQAEDAALQAEVEQLLNQLADTLASNPDDLTGWQLLAGTALRAGKLDMAAQAYRRLMAMQPEEQAYGNTLQVVLFMQGETAKRAGDAAALRQHWTELIALLPDSDPRKAKLRGELQALDNPGNEAILEP